MLSRYLIQANTRGGQLCASETVLLSEEQPSYAGDVGLDDDLPSTLAALAASGDSFSEEDSFIDLCDISEDEPPADEDEPQLSSTEPSPDTVVVPDETLWDALQAELSSVSSQECEISAFELSDFKPEDRVTVLFDMVEEQLVKPGKEPLIPEILPSSVQRKVDASDLSAAFTNYEKEERKLAQIKQAAALAAASGEVAENNVIGNLPVAGIARRLWAAVIDLAASGTAALVITVLLFAPADVRSKLLSFRAVGSDEALAYLFMWIGIWGATWVVASVFLTLSNGQTIGQRMTKTQVVDELGGLVSVDNAVVRVLSQFATLLTLGLGLAPIFGKTRQTLHDRLSRTVVTTVGALF